MQLAVSCLGVSMGRRGSWLSWAVRRYERVRAGAWLGSHVSAHVRLRGVILVLIVLACAGTFVSCGADKQAAPLNPLELSKQAAEQAAQALLGAASTGPDASSAQAELNKLKVAPLNQDFLDSLTLPAVDASSIAAVGYPLGERPTSQDFSYARGMQIPSLSELVSPPGSEGEAPPGAIPTSFDLRKSDKLTSVKDQNPYGTCWAFATLGSLESLLRPGDSWDLSEDNMVLNSGFDNGSDPYNWGGTLEMSTAYLVRWGGPVDESGDAYGDGYTPAELSPNMHVQEVNWIPPRGSALDNTNIKNAIMQYGGVYVAMGWYGDASGSPYYDASTASYYHFVLSQANHAVLAVGWDDDYPAANFAMSPSGDGAFLVKNSWGTGFGDGGYFYVSYYDTTFGRVHPLGVVSGAESTSNYSGVYQYDPLGDVNGMGYGSPTAWFANVFTAQETSWLSAVGFYALAPGTSYEVYTGTSLTSMTLDASGTLAYMGYHTVTLSEPVALTSGDPFMVAVKVTSPGTDSPVAIEYPIADFSSAATAQPGQSYVSSDGTDWSDLTTEGDANANVCLKAYVTTEP
ncbi:MAG: lectin like domain-containing protein [bacterium]